MMLEIIEAIICQDRKISPESLHCRSRFTEVREPRQIIMYFARMKTTLSLYQIGRYFNLDHATVINAVKTINNYIATEPDFKHRIETYTGIIDNYTDNDLNSTFIAIEVLKIEINTLKRQLTEKETILVTLQNQMK